MNRHFSYLPEFSNLVSICARLRRNIRANGRDVAAFHVPNRILRTIFAECGQELRDITMFGKFVYGYEGGGGVVAEKGLRLNAPRWELKFCEA